MLATRPLTLAILIPAYVLSGCASEEPNDKKASSVAQPTSTGGQSSQEKVAESTPIETDDGKAKMPQPVLNLKMEEKMEEMVEEMMEVTEPQVETIDNCAETSVTALDTTELVPADIIIAVDMSSSMTAEAVFVQEQLNYFSEQIIATGVDARVILIALPNPTAREGAELPPMCIAAPLGSGTCPDDSLLPGYLHINEYVGSNDALNQLVDTFPLWRDQLRPNSLKAFFVVSDDDAKDDPNDSAAAFTTNLEALDPDLFQRWNMNAVYAFSMCEDDEGEGLAAAIGTVYQELVAQTGGVEGDLCSQNFQPVFDSLATQIVENAGAEIVCEWEVPAAVPGQTFSTDLVQVTRTSGVESAASELLTRVLSTDDCAAGGWYFDDNYDPTRIIACESTCAGMQDDVEGGIDVAFGCEVVEGCTASGEAVLMPASEVAEAEVSCAWLLPEADDLAQLLDPETVNVRYTSNKGFSVLMGAVAGPDDCASAELGWHYDDPERPKSIIACQQTCDVLTERQITQVNALFGCKTKPAPPVR